MHRTGLALLLFGTGFLGLLLGWPYILDSWTRPARPQPAPAPTPAEPAVPRVEAADPAQQPPALDEAVEPAEELEAITEAADPFVEEALRRAAEDPQAAMEWITDLSLHDGRIDQVVMAIQQVSTAWAASEPAAALAWIETHLDVTRVDSIGNAVAIWATTNPDSAAEWIEGMAVDGSMEEAAATLASTWVLNDPAAASGWVATLQGGRLRDEAAAAMVASWSETDLPGATAWALEEARRYGNTEPFLNAVSRLAVAPGTGEEGVSGLILATELVDRLPPGPFADEAAGTIVSSLAQVSVGDEIADWILVEEATGDASTRMFPNQDPAVLARSFMREWAYADSVAASEKLATLDSGPVRDNAVIGFAETMTEFDPLSAAAWVNTLSDPELRMNQLESVIATWSRTQPVEAIRWVKSADLEPALRDHLASEIPWD